MKKTHIFMLLTISLFLFLGCKPEVNIPKEKSCNTDADCVAASCCHADSCVNAEFAPDCEGLMCTLECKPGTMDCGQGGCLCQNNGCIAQIEGQVISK